MKPQIKGAVFKMIPLALSLILTTACGKKNQVKAPAAGVGTTVMGIPNLPASSGAQIQQMISSFPCSTGQRMPELQFSTTGAQNGGNSTLIGPNFTQGLISGPVSSVFIGKSSFNDIMIVTKIANGNQLMGFNVTVSMCQFNPLIMPGRSLSGLTADQGIILTENTSTGLGTVIAQNTVSIAGQYQNYPATNVTTTYAPVSTSGGYTGGGYTGGWTWP